MKEAVKLMLIPIIGSIAIAMIFILVVWSGNFQAKIENEDGQEYKASEDIGGYAVLVPEDCDDSYFPVCGIDGKDYGNACLAVKAETKVAYRGVCQS